MRQVYVESENVSCSVVSNSLWPYGLQPARLLCPWNFPDKNTGVGCHPFSRDLPDPGIEPGSPALQVDSLPSEPPSVIKGTRGNSISFSAAQLLRVPKVHLKTTDEVPWGTSQDHSAYPNGAYSSKGDRQRMKKQITNHRDILGGPVVKNLPSNAEDMGSITDQGTKISHARGQLSPLTTTREPTYCNEDPVQPK